MKTTKYQFRYGKEGKEDLSNLFPSKGHRSREAAEREMGLLSRLDFKYFSDIESYEEEVQIKIDITRVNRVEIIGEGREFVRYFDSGEFSLQDSGRTLKIFVGRE